MIIESRLFRAVRHSIGGHPAGADSDREVRVRVRGGYDPDTIYSQAGIPLRLVFRREESSAHSEQVVFPAFGKSFTLPEGEQVVVEILPIDPGTYEFTCSMGLLRGKLVISPRGETEPAK